MSTGEPHTAHTSNPVPFILANFQTENQPKSKNGIQLRNGSLADVAPTILNIFKIDKPKDMSGRSLLQIDN